MIHILTENKSHPLNAVIFTAFLGTILGVFWKVHSELAVWICTLILAILLVRIHAHSLGIDSQWPVLACTLASFLGLLTVTSIFGGFSPDEMKYYELGWEMGKQWKTGELWISPYHSVSTSIYSVIIAITYLVVGKVYSCIIVLNACFWGLATVYWLRITKSVFGYVPSTVGGLFVLFPAAILYTGSNLREPLTLLLVALVVWRYVIYTESQQKLSLAVIGILLVPIAILRDEIFLSLIVALSVSTLIYHLKYTNRRDFLASSVGLLLIVTGATVFLPLDDIRILGIEVLEQQRRFQVQRPGGYLTELSYTSWRSIIFSLPIRAFYLLYHPFPWDMSKFGEWPIRQIDSLYFLTISAPLLFSLKSGRNKNWNVILFLALFCSFSLAGYSLMISSPSNMRRRLMFAPILLVFSGIGLSNVLKSIRIKGF